MRTQTEGQIAVAMAEASEARMVNKRLKKQNELLLTQIRTLINEAEEYEKKLQDAKEKLQQSEVAAQSNESTSNGADASVMMLDLSVEQPPLEVQSSAQDSHLNDAIPSEASQDETTEEEDSPVPYTLSEDDIALLNGRPPPSSRPELVSSPETARSLSFSSSASRVSHESPYRSRLIAFFEERDPEKISEVDEMLASYKGVEESLFESLELKYSFMELNQRIAQAM
eukprot:jgi/Phyca11/504452/fgenesh2_kg.PHYCAscaffold_8_\